MKEITSISTEISKNLELDYILIQKKLIEILSLNDRLNFMDTYSDQLCCTYREFFNKLTHWMNYSYCSKRILLSELNTVIENVNGKILVYNEGEVLVRIIAGEKKGDKVVLPTSAAKLLVDYGFAVEIMTMREAED